LGVLLRRIAGHRGPQHRTHRGPGLDRPHGANGQYVILAGLVATAVGCETVIAHPLDAASLAAGLLLGGGPLLYVATQTWFLHVTTRTRLTTRWVACVILAAAIPIAAVLPPLATLGLVAITLAALSIYAPRHRYTH
jgi:low temperature requirement protein LtrA